MMKKGGNKPRVIYNDTIIIPHGIKKKMTFKFLPRNHCKSQNGEYEKLLLLLFFLFLFFLKANLSQQFVS